MSEYCCPEHMADSVPDEAVEEVISILLQRETTESVAQKREQIRLLPLPDVEDVRLAEGDLEVSND